VEGSPSYASGRRGNGQTGTNVQYVRQGANPPGGVRPRVLDVSRRTVLAAASAAFALVSAVAAPTMATSAATAPATAVTAKLVVRSSGVTEGTPLRGRLVLTNSGDRTVDLNDGCAPKWTVVLGRGRTAPGVAFSMECSPAPFRTAPGDTERRFRVDTDDRRPGRYRLFLVASAPSFPEAKPVKVRIVRAR
jgi:hypothetical protein